MTRLFIIPSLLAGIAVFAWVYPAKSPKNILSGIGRAAPRFTRKRYERVLDVLNHPMEPEMMAGIKFGGLILGVVLGVLALWLYGIQIAVVFFALALFAWVYPDQWLRRKEEKRQADLHREFPLMVTLVRVYARASDLYQALHIARGALKGELRREMDLLVSELQVAPLRQALENFAARCNCPPITNFVSVVLFGITTGANVDHILDSFARRAYEARVNDIKRKIKAQPIIMSILPAVMMFSLMILFIVPMFANIIERIRGFL